MTSASAKRVYDEGATVPHHPGLEDRQDAQQVALIGLLDPVKAEAGVMHRRLRRPWGGATGAILAVVAGAALVAVAVANRTEPPSAMAQNQTGPHVPGRETAAVMPAAPAHQVTTAKAVKAVRRRAWKLAKVAREGTIIRAARSAAAPARYTCKAGAILMVEAVQDDWCAVALQHGQTGWVPKADLKFMGLRAVEVVPEAGKSAVVADAMNFLWAPYVRGGASTTGTDCSGMVQAVFRKHGVQLPRTAAEQFGVGQPVYQRELRPGDRVFFVGNGGVVNHVGIYVGDGAFIHASGRHGKVVISKLADYQHVYAGARR